MIEQGIYAQLTANAGVAAIAGPNVFPLVLPEEPALPAVTYQVISSVPLYTIAGPLGLAKTRIQVDCWATSYAACKQLAAAVRAALDNFSGKLPDGTLVSSTQVLNVTDYLDGTTRLYRVQFDFSFMAST